MNRKEATSLTWDELTSSQQSALNRINASIRNALTGLEKENIEDRYNNNFFVSGEPGSGKTTAYLTLRKQYRRDHRLSPKEPRHLNEEERSRIVWLEPLDLESSPDSSNLLAGLLVRLDERLFTEQGESRNFVRRGGLLEDQQGLQLFRRLQNDVVLAWHGTVPERAQHVGPDVFSLDVLRAERSRLHVNRRLREVFDGLTTATKTMSDLYVLPVDDFYLKPEASIEFLRLLRMISVPQLFILMMGDLDVVEELFYQDMLGTLINLAGDVPYETSPIQQSTLSNRAHALTAHALRKLVPPAQHVKLESMENLQALSFSPTDEPTLEDLLKKCALNLESSSFPPSSKPPSNLYDFLLVRPFEFEKKQYSYSGLEVLDLPPREAVDLWQVLSQSLEATNEIDKGTLQEDSPVDIGGRVSTKLLSTIFDQTVRALGSDTYLQSDERSIFENAIDGGNLYRARILDRSAIHFSSKTTILGEVDHSLEGIVRLARHVSWQVRTTRAPITVELSSDLVRNREVHKGAYLAPRPTAWFTVLYDLVTLSQKRIDGASLTPKPFELDWVTIDGGMSSGRPCWITPQWATFREFDLFAYEWSKVLDLYELEREQITNRVDWLVFHWINIIVSQLIGDNQVIDLPESQSITLDQFGKLNSKIVKLASYCTAPLPREYQSAITFRFILDMKQFLSSDYLVSEFILENLNIDSLSAIWNQNLDEESQPLPNKGGATINELEAP